MTVHYRAVSPGDLEATFALEMARADAWAALAWNPGSPTSMVGATAVIVTDSAGAGGIGVYSLGGKTVSAVTELRGATSLAASTGVSAEDAAAVQGPALGPVGLSPPPPATPPPSPPPLPPPAPVPPTVEESDSYGGYRRLSQVSDFTITEASVDRRDGRMLAIFTRSCPGACATVLPPRALVAFGASAALTGAHTAREDVGFDILGGGGVSAGDSGASTRTLIRVHAGLMVTSWGVLIPLAVILASTLRTFAPLWFQLHRGLNGVGLILALGAFILALARFDSLESGDRHKSCGIAAMVLGLLQPLNGVVRPHAPEPGAKKGALRLVWEVAHRALGSLALVLAFSAIYLGIQRAETFSVVSDATPWEVAFTALLVVLAVLWAALLSLYYLKWRSRGAGAGQLDLEGKEGGHRGDAGRLEGQ